MSRVFVEDVLPTRAELDFYRDYGWLLTNLVVREEHLQRCAAAIEELQRAQYDAVLPWSTHKAVIGFQQPYSDRTRPRMDSYVSHHKTALREVLRSAHLGRYAAQLLGTTEVRLWRDLLLTMPPGPDSYTGLHVDKNYWITASSDLLSSAWFSLDDCDASGGCMLMANGSHQWPRSMAVRKLAVDDLDGVARLYGVQRNAVSMTVVPQKRGQISFHSSRVLHGSLPNTSSRTRQTLVVTLQDRDNHYRAPVTPEEMRLAAFCLNDRVGPSSDQIPDYRSPSFYPVIYQSASLSALSTAQEAPQ